MAAGRRGRWVGGVVLAVGLGLGLSACKTLVQRTESGDWVAFPEGSALEILVPIAIAPGRARAYLGDRRSPAAEGATCMLEVRRIAADRVQQVPPGRARISRVQSYLALVSDAAPVPGTLRAPRWQLAGHDDGGSQMVRLGYHFWLDHPADPNLMRLTCLGLHEDLANNRPPTLEEIRAALVGQARLVLGRESSS